MKSYIAKTIANSDKGLLLLLVLPWLLLINNDAWIFDYHVMIDPWFYFGFFLRFKQLLEIYGDTYYASRMAWILPGHIVFEIFPPLVAQYLLHVGFYYLAVISIYLLLRRTVGYRSALLSSVMMGCYSWFLIAIGSNYVDGAGIAYYSSATFMLILATQEARWRVFLFLGGVFYGLALYSNLSWFLLAPPLTFYYFLVNHKHRKNSLISSSIFFILGLISITLCLCVVNFAAGGNFLFFLPSLKFLFWAASLKESPYKISWDMWLPGAFWLIFATTTFVSGTVLMLLSCLKKMPPIHSVTLGFQVAFLISALPFIISEIKNQPFLQFYYYASYLIPSTFIAIGAQLSQFESILNNLKQHQFWLIIASTISLTLVAYQSSIQPLLLQNQALLVMLFLLTLWLILIGSTFLIYAQVKRIASYALLTLILSFNIINFVSIARAAVVVPPISSTLGYSSTSTLTNSTLMNPTLNKVHFSQRHAAFLLTVDAQKYLEIVDPKVQLMFWYDINEQWIYRSITHSCLCIQFSEEFPHIEKEGDVAEKSNIIDKLKTRPNVVILSQRADALEQAKRSLNKLGFDAKLIRIYDVKQEDLSFRMTFIKIRNQNT